MGTRRRSRELAMQALFYMDLSKNVSKDVLELFCNNFTPSKKILPFFFKLVIGVMNKRLELDTIIERFSSNWKISRMSCVDRNILRIAVYEMLCCQDIPSKVSINEAIDMGKKFGTEESGAFINGVLDSIRIASEQEDVDIKKFIQNDQKDQVLD
ncbi:MAG: transcription antitermination factor NusB [Desulfobacterales bacterium]|nr:transcription antitermination factor NusB [Desulfobacterales bacterium]